MIAIFVVTFFIPVLLLIVGFVLKNKYSHYPDMSCGYHVGKLRSKSEETWREANEYSGKFFIADGIIVAIMDVIVLIYSINTITGPFSDYIWWAIFIIIYIGITCFVPVIITILSTQLHLKNHFFKDGSRKI